MFVLSKRIVFSCLALTLIGSSVSAQTQDLSVYMVGGVNHYATSSNGSYNGPSCLGYSQESGSDNTLPYIVSPVSMKVRRKISHYKSRGQSYNIGLAKNCAEAIEAVKLTMDGLDADNRLCPGAKNVATYSCTPNLMMYASICEPAKKISVEDTWSVKATFNCN
jgi:hypothetical protein